MPDFERPVDVPLTVLGGKWKLILLFYLSERARRPSELRRLVPAITQKMLTQQLRQLEADGLVRRIDHGEVPPRVEYVLVDAERERLAPVLAALCTWGLERARRTGATVRVLDEGGEPSEAGTTRPGACP